MPYPHTHTSSLCGHAVTVGIGLSLRSSAENFVMGLVLTLIKPFVVGDLVAIAGNIRGKVKHIFFAYTVVNTPDGTTGAQNSQCVGARVSARTGRSLKLHHDDSGMGR